jgi:AcrR family transcriptional regulator
LADPTAKPYHHGNLAAAALAAAEAEITEHGIAAASLRRVAERAGVSHTAVGKRFGDKAGLLAAVAAAGFGLLGDALAAAAPDMRAMGRAYVSFAVTRPALFTVMFQPAVYRADDPAVVAARARTTAMLRSGVGQRRGDATADVAIGAWAFVHGLASLVIGGAVEGDPLALYERAAAAIFQGREPKV